jgi:UDP-N-acetyl-D-mannosaminuronic acid dehydrogenase
LLAVWEVLPTFDHGASDGDTAHDRGHAVNDHTVCVVGLGYVGLTLAVSLADVGYKVHGVEIREDVRATIAAGRAPFHEPGLEDAIARHLRNGMLRIGDVTPDASVYIITVGTPLGHSGRVRVDAIENATREIAAAMPSTAMVVLRSTVKIGTTRRLAAMLPASSHVAFCPERTLEGHALVELRGLPQIVGGLTPEAAERASAMFHCLTPTVIRVTDPETAEMIKLISNAHRDVQFGYANEIAQMCDAIGISASEVIRSGNLHYPRTNLPGPGPVGGPCLTKDSHILSESLEPFDVLPRLTTHARALNEATPSLAVSFIRSAADRLGVRARKVALLGWAFKGRPDTDDLRGSQAMVIRDALQPHFADAIFVGWDPVVAPGAMAPYASWRATLREAMYRADLVVLMNNHPSLLQVRAYAYAMATPGIVYDFWGQHTSTGDEWPAGVRYFAFGSHGRSG